MSKGIRYECKSCHQAVELFVTPLSPPSHACKKRSKRIYELEIVDENRDSKRRPHTAD